MTFGHATSADISTVSFLTDGHARRRGSIIFVRTSDVYRLPLCRDSGRESILARNSFRSPSGYLTPLLRRRAMITGIASLANNVLTAEYDHGTAASRAGTLARA